MRTYVHTYIRDTVCSLTRTSTTSANSLKPSICMCRVWACVSVCDVLPNTTHTPQLSSLTWDLNAYHSVALANPYHHIETSPNPVGFKIDLQSWLVSLGQTSERGGGSGLTCHQPACQGSPAQDHRVVPSSTLYPLSASPHRLSRLSSGCPGCLDAYPSIISSGFCIRT